jgi:peroxiredoxin
LRFYFVTMRRFYFLLLIMFVLSSCSKVKHNFTVKVNVSGGKNVYLYLAKRTLSGTAVIDSALPDKSNNYILKGFTTQPDFYIVYCDIHQYINLIVHPDDDFRVLTHAASFDANYIIEGSKDSRLIQKMVDMQAKTLEKITEISNRYESSVGTKDHEKTRKAVDSIYNLVFTEHKKFSVDLIRENPGSLVGLMALYQQLGRNAPVFDYKKDFQYYAFVDSNLSALYPGSEAVIDLDRKVNQLRNVLKLQVGAVAPVLALPDTAGNLVKLSSLRGKYVVVLFWASWSPESMAELKTLADILNKAKREDVELYQVSLDRTRESWTKCLHENSFRGMQVSDLKYWDSPVVGSYQIERLPMMFLLDKNGVILRRDFHAVELPATLPEKQ